jgi:hypothetical protein
MRLTSILLAVLSVLAVCSGIAPAAEVAPAPGAAATPTAVSVTTNSQGQSVTTYSDGSKVVTAASFGDCPDGWVCLWTDSNYSGRMLQFQDRGSWQNLTAWSFNDEASSWRNRTNDDAKLAQNLEGGGNQVCMQPNSSNSMLTGFNDEATSIRIFKTSTVC